MRPLPSTVMNRTRRGRPYSLRPWRARMALAASSAFEYSTKQNLCLSGFFVFVQTPSFYYHVGGPRA